MANLNLNKAIIGGRICTDTELKVTPSGTQVCKFNVAVNRQSKDNKEADFITVVTWNKTAELVSKYFNKGSSICVEGRIQSRSWEDKDGRKLKATEVIADTVYFVDSKDEKAESKIVPNFTEVTDDDDLPF